MRWEVKTGSDLVQTPRAPDGESQNGPHPTRLKQMDQSDANEGGFQILVQTNLCLERGVLIPEKKKGERKTPKRIALKREKKKVGMVISETADTHRGAKKNGQVRAKKLLQKGKKTGKRRRTNLYLIRSRRQLAWGVHGGRQRQYRGSGSGRQKAEEAR